LGGGGLPFRQTIPAKIADNHQLNILYLSMALQMRE
jgi:hypothetical protein